MRHALPFALIVSGTVLSIAGTDLVLPAVPELPEALSGTPAEAQLVLAAFTAGMAAGLLLFGALASRFDARTLLVASLALYGATSAACALSPTLDTLVVLRALQGAAGAGPSVFAPGMLRALYGDDRAVGAISVLSSVESLVPALAPILGLALLRLGGWTTSFAVLAALALSLAAMIRLMGHCLPAIAAGAGGGYARLLAAPRFLRHTLGFALTLGALLVFVFGAPAVITHSLGGTLTDFIVLQIAGIATFIVAANLSGRLVRRHGGAAVIVAGTLIAAAGGALLLAYALAGGGDLGVIIALSLLLNIGHGLRGPPSFHGAILAARGDDARAAALVVVTLLGVTAAGTAVVAPFVTDGLVPLAAVTAAIYASALATIVPSRRSLARG